MTSATHDGLAWQENYESTKRPKSLNEIANFFRSFLSRTRMSDDTSHPRSSAPRMRPQANSFFCVYWKVHELRSGKDQHNILHFLSLNHMLRALYFSQYSR